MKLLLDENLSRRLIPFLQHDYPGSSQVVLLGLEAASDNVVWHTVNWGQIPIVSQQNWKWT
jgi:predicted nuclease of predicted toxin-antitoxin system